MRDDVAVRELPKPIRRPDGWTLAPTPVMTNFDHTIDEDVVAELLRGAFVGQHAALDFCGYVWHAEGVWFETVWRYNSPVASYSCADLDALRRYVNNEWGND